MGVVGLDGASNVAGTEGLGSDGLSSEGLGLGSESFVTALNGSSDILSIILTRYWFTLEAGVPRCLMSTRLSCSLSCLSPSHRWRTFLVEHDQQRLLHVCQNLREQSYCFFVCQLERVEHDAADRIGRVHRLGTGEYEGLGYSERVRG